MNTFKGNRIEFVTDFAHQAKLVISTKIITDSAILWQDFYFEPTDSTKKNLTSLQKEKRAKPVYCSCTLLWFLNFKVFI